MPQNETTKPHTGNPVLPETVVWAKTPTPTEGYQEIDFPLENFRTSRNFSYPRPKEKNNG